MKWSILTFALKPLLLFFFNFLTHGVFVNARVFVMNLYSLCREQSPTTTYISTNTNITHFLSLLMFLKILELAFLTGCGTIRF